MRRAASSGNRWKVPVMIVGKWCPYWLLDAAIVDQG
jgi:hypothetical protein